MHKIKTMITSSSVPSDPALRTKALESLLVEKGLVDPAALDAVVTPTRTRSDRATAPASWRVLG
jgi:hypothetical protein